MAIPRKVGQTRMDAAIDALIPLGFSKGFIRKKVKALLEVYDGEWKFIEEASYKVLIDAIIDEQEGECANNENQASKEDDEDDDDNELFDTNDATQPGASTGTTKKPMTSTRTEHKTAKKQGNAMKTSTTDNKNVNNTGMVGHRRRKPCYGWISSDSSDEEDSATLATVASKRKGTQL